MNQLNRAVASAQQTLLGPLRHAAEVEMMTAAPRQVPLRILCLSEYFHPHWTGIAKGFLSIARDLVERGHNVRVLTTRFDRALPRTDALFGIEIRRVPYLCQISRSQYSPRTILALLGEIRSADLVIINSPYSNILPCALIAKLAGRRLTVFHQGDLTLPTQSGNRWINRAVEAVFNVSTGVGFRLADKVATYTKDYARHSRLLPAVLDKFEPVIPRITLAPPSRSGRVHSRLGALRAQGRTLIGFAGRFVEEKGFDILLAALPLVMERFPRAHFVFAGQTNISYEPFFELHKHSVERHKAHIELLGLLQGGDLTTFYQSLDLFVLPSRSDCFALTQLEAAMCGIPIVVSDIPGSRELIRATGFGEIVPPSDPRRLADGICRVLESPERYRALRSNVTDYLDAHADTRRCL